MKIKDLSKEELELMGYDDIALLVLQENGHKMKLKEIFARVCEILELPAETVDNQIMDFFEQLSINKKFIMLDNGFWDLQTRHNFDLVVDEEEETEETEEKSEEEVDEITEDEEDEDIFYDKTDETDDVEDDDLADLVVVDDIEEENL